MRSKKVQLEQAVIDAARAWSKPILGFDAAAETERERLGLLLWLAVEALDAHLAQITDAKGAFVPGSDTSENAAFSGRLAAGTLRRRIIDEVRSVGLRSFDIHGLTDDELERRLMKPHTSVSSARNWLVDAGWLRDSSHRRLTRNGRDATVWQLTEAALAAVSSPEWIERSRP